MYSSGFAVRKAFASSTVNPIKLGTFIATLPVETYKVIFQDVFCRLNRRLCEDTNFRSLH